MPYPTRIHTETVRIKSLSGSQRRHRRETDDADDDEQGPRGIYYITPFRVQLPGNFVFFYLFSFASSFGGGGERVPRVPCI